MKTINKNLTWKEVEDDVIQKKSLSFSATTADINFEKTELELTLDVTKRFPLDSITLQNIGEILSMEALGLADIPPFSKIQMLVKHFDGTTYYQKVDSKGIWEVNIVFNKTEI